MPKITLGDETKGVPARKPVVKLPRLRLPNVVFHRNNTNNVKSTRIPDKPYPKYDLQIIHVDDRVIIKAPVVNPTKTLIPQSQVKNKSDLDKSDTMTIPAKVNPINQTKCVDIPAKIDQSSSTDIPAKVDPVKQTNIPVKPMNVKSNTTSIEKTPVHYLHFIKLLETIGNSKLYLPIPPIIEVERTHLSKLQNHFMETASKLRTALRVFDFKYMKKVPGAPCITRVQLNCETRREISLRDKKDTEKKNVSDISTQTGEIICVKPIIIPDSQKSPFERTQTSLQELTDYLRLKKIEKVTKEVNELYNKPSLVAPVKSLKRPITRQSTGNSGSSAPKKRRYVRK
jgi:hypothetical protein